jgi:hypothetical protein
LEAPLKLMNIKTASEMGMSKKPDMVMVVITLFIAGVLASGVAQSALL